LSVKIDCRYFLLHLTDDQMIIDVKGNTIKECLEQLVARYYKVQKWLYGSNGELAPYISIHVNLENVIPNELSDTVKDGDTIFIVFRYH
jgi:hypothetical protein